MNKHILPRLILISLATIAAITGHAAATDAEAKTAMFDKFFNDSTLRIDYIFAADSLHSHAFVKQQVLTPGWYGRRTHLNEVPRKGNGCITMTDAATGDTIYRHTFSSLFLEWLSTDEAQEGNGAFENGFLVPQPREKALITVELFGSRLQPIARTVHTYSPTDILVRRPKVEAAPHRYLHRATDPANAIDVVILGEGYTADEMDSFYTSAQIAADEILSYEPFCRYADHFNFIAVESPAPVSGLSIPRLNDWKDTPFESHYSTFYSDRYLTTANTTPIHEALRDIPYEHIIILANTDEYGGGGIYNSYTLTTARNPMFRPVVVHEFGHSFGGLADEYFYESDALDDSYPVDVEPWEPNITTLVDFDSKWKSLLPEGTPVPTPIEEKEKHPFGVFEGGGYRFHGIYRPADECRMRNNTYPTFCPACQAALEELIKFYIN